MKEGKSACWHYSIVWWFPLHRSTQNSCKLDVQWDANVAITTTSVLTVLRSISLFRWATFFLHEEMCVCLPLELCMVRNQWDAKWYHIFPHWKMWDINICWFENERVHFVNSLGRGYKTIKAAFTNWTEQHFISCIFDLRCCVEDISLHTRIFWDCDQYHLQQMLQKHLNKALLLKIHRQIQTAYIHCPQVALIKLTFDHQI